MLKNQESYVLLLTGLSGAGKTTIATALQKQLLQKGRSSVLLDGDEIRNIIQLHAFDEASRKAHNLRIAKMASLFEAQGNIVIISIIAPYADVRSQMRKLCNNFYEIYLSTSIETCMERDPKGLYKKALSGEINNFTGVSAPYEIPENPELSLDTAILSIEQCTDKVLSLLFYSYE